MDVIDRLSLLRGGRWLKFDYIVLNSAFNKKRFSKMLKDLDVKYDCLRMAYSVF